MLEEILYQTSPAQTVSEKYEVIPTIEVIQEFEKFGFQIDAIESAGTRSMERALKQKHMVRMSAEEKMFGGEVVPQVIIHNSYDGSASLNIHVGIFRFVCSNGMVAGKNLIPPLRIVHKREAWRDIVGEFVDTYEERYAVQKEFILELKERPMSLDEAYHLAEMSLGFRHADPRLSNDAVDPLELLIAKRREDRGDRAWHRFNILEESLVNGYYRKYMPSGSIVKAKKLTDIDEIIRVNADLWDLFNDEVIGLQQIKLSMSEEY